MPFQLLVLLLLALVSAGTAEDCAGEGTVELVGLEGVEHAGIVRVCRGGVWGTVCAEVFTPWSQKNSQVACRRAGFAGAVNPILQLTMPASARLLVLGDPIHYRRLSCNGTENTLTACSLSTSTFACIHDYDAAVTCKPYSSSAARAGDVRLLGDTDDGKGAVEYYDMFLGWTGVCVDSFHSSDWLVNYAAASIVCQQLGYERGTPIIQQGISTVAMERRVAGNLGCVLGQDFNLDSCTVGRVTCDISSDLPAGGVICSTTSDEDGSVRLVGGDGRCGVVEVAYNGRWGTICDDGEWDIDDASIVCNQLGYPGPTASISDQYPEYYSQFNKPTWLGGVECDDTDLDIDSCPSSLPIGYSTTCSGNDTSRAEVECSQDPAPPDDGGLSGGAIAGIVIGSIVGLGLIAYFIHLCGEAEKKKKAAAAAEASRSHGEAVAAQQRRDREVQQRRDEAAAQRALASAQQPPAPADSQLEGTEETAFQDAELVTAPPPSYQTAVAFPVPVPPPNYSSEKSGAYPSQNFPYPPATSSGFEAYPPPSAPCLADYPAPPVGFNPAYPPPM